MAKNLEGMERKILIQMTILKIIRAHIGEGHAIPRVQLLDTLITRGYSLNDRRMREAISHLRMTTTEGAWICSNQKGDGYFYAETVAELSEHLESERKRGLTILTKVSAQAKRALPELAGQFNITVGAG